MPGERQDLRRRLNQVAFQQAGYFTARQAVQFGYSHQAQKYHADHGNWTRIDRGLFRLPEWPSNSTDEYVRWALWSNNRAILSHESALAFHGLSDTNPPRIHLTVPPGFRAADPHVRLVTDNVSDDDVEHHQGFRVTTVERTLLDIASIGASQELLDQAVGDALDTGRTTGRRLRRRAADASDRAALGIERALNHREVPQ